MLPDLTAANSKQYIDGRFQVVPIGVCNFTEYWNRYEFRSLGLVARARSSASDCFCQVEVYEHPCNAIGGSGICDDDVVLCNVPIRCALIASRSADNISQMDLKSYRGTTSRRDRTITKQAVVVFTRVSFAQALWCARVQLSAQF